MYFVDTRTQSSVFMLLRGDVEINMKKKKKKPLTKGGVQALVKNIASLHFFIFKINIHVPAHLPALPPVHRLQNWVAGAAT